MNEYKKLMMEILQLEEDIVRTSGVEGGGGDLDSDDPLNEKDDIISDFGGN